VIIYRFTLFKEKLAKLLETTEEISFDDVFIAVNADMSSVDSFTPDETYNALEKMSESNQIFYSDGTVYRI
jgi:hypothetical protein